MPRYRNVTCDQNGVCDRALDFLVKGCFVLRLRAVEVEVGEPEELGFMQSRSHTNRTPKGAEQEGLRLSFFKNPFLKNILPGS